MKRHYNELDRDYPGIDGVSTRAVLKSEEFDARVSAFARLLSDAESAHAKSGDPASEWPEWYARFILDASKRAETPVPAVLPQAPECSTCGHPHIGEHDYSADYNDGLPWSEIDSLADCPTCRKPVLSPSNRQHVNLWAFPFVLFLLPGLLSAVSLITTWSNRVAVDSLMSLVSR